MNGMAMDGAHAMSMAWAPGAALSFVSLWTAMMAVMMLPSLVPAFWRYARASGESAGVGLVLLPTIAVATYLGVWGAVGVAVYPLELVAARAGASMAPRGPALAVAAIVLLAGVTQFSAWKSRHLAGCREPLARCCGAPVSAWRYGARLGWDCVSSSAGLMALVLAVGAMDLRVMAAVTGAITAERLAPAGERIAQWVGGATVCAGVVLVARAAVS